MSELGSGLGLGFRPPSCTASEVRVRVRVRVRGRVRVRVRVRVNGLATGLRAVGGDRGQRAAEGDERRLVDELTVDLG